jgi:hypothetical protein
MSKVIKVFNNELEMGLRILVILETVYPKSYDIEMINYYDYFILHTKDIGGDKSLHADVPNRYGELSVKRELIRNSTKLLLSRGLINVEYSGKGIEYRASEATSPFLANLEEEYTVKLIENATWVHNKFKDYSFDDFNRFIMENKNKWGTENPYCTIGLIDE